MNGRIVMDCVDAAYAAIKQHADEIMALDQAIGDGDHGTNLDRGFSAIVTALDARGSVAGPPNDPTVTADTLRLAGRTLISTVGGASGPLYGTAFLRSAAAVGQADPSATSGAILAAALDAASEGVAALGKSTTGEKTMLDALVPAAAAARSAAAAGGDAPAVAAAARDAAAAGAEATIPMLATKGRASYLGERSIGHQDPGATSLSILLGALADSIG
jgi:dihydroxyacetone kinase-like protein